MKIPSVSSLRRTAIGLVGSAIVLAVVPKMIQNTPQKTENTVKTSSSPMNDYAIPIAIGLTGLGVGAVIGLIGLDDVDDGDDDRCKNGCGQNDRDNSPKDLLGLLLALFLRNVLFTVLLRLFVGFHLLLTHGSILSDCFRPVLVRQIRDYSTPHR